MKDFLFDNMNDQERADIGTEAILELKKILPRDTRCILLLTISEGGVPTLAHHLNVSGTVLNKSGLRKIIQGLLDHLDSARSTTVSMKNDGQA